MERAQPLYTTYRFHRQAACRGFTLIEVMVVVVILGILAAIIVPRVVDRPKEAAITRAQGDIRQLEQQIKLYHLDNNAYPTTDQGLQALVEKPTIPPEPAQWRGYLDRLPKDPWGRPYQYVHPGAHGEFDVFSRGPDPQTDEDDIGNWNLE